MGFRKRKSRKRFWYNNLVLVINFSQVHGNEINCCQWHPFQGLIASGSKDSTIKFWDPNSGEELASL